MRERKIKLIAFDLDGTLCNTIADIAASMNRALVKHNIVPYTEMQIQGMVGHSMVNLCRRAMPNGREDEWRAVMEDYFSDYSRHLTDTTCPYAGIPELLSALKAQGYTLACVSNKPHPNTVQMITELFSHRGEVFSRVQGQNEKFTLKPHPDSLLFVIRNLGFTPEETLYVGDSDVDYQFARNAMTHFCGVAWGFKGRALLEELNSEFIIDNPGELFGVLEQL